MNSESFSEAPMSLYYSKYKLEQRYKKLYQEHQIQNLPYKLVNWLGGKQGYS